MKALIIIAHGSRRQQSNDEIVGMVNAVRTRTRDKYDLVLHSYLEICAPSLPAAVSDAIEQGADNITVYPFFLNSGNHVLRDIPKMIEELDRANAGVIFHLMPHFGKSENIPDLIADHVKS
ncbi:MAG TPA: CbiX/SirB N-terminal domain-containing protein [Gammaproteobacteria bacterium]|nr:CbiX/SirB N-terminal domain-containing protein [Gammaproteobacteria bacterium]